MKKCGKLFAAILTLAVILSLFTACDSGQKAEDKLVGRDLLIGDWRAEFNAEDMALAMQFTFKADGNGEFTFPQESYDAFIDQMIARTKAELSADELAEEGIANDETLRLFLSATYPYEKIAESFYMTFSWTLDGDTLTVKVKDGDTMTASTKLSEGNESFALVKEDGSKLALAKIN